MTGRIGVIADTHGDAGAWEAAVRTWGRVDLVIHAGDVLRTWKSRPQPPGRGRRKLAELLNAYDTPILCARGNCDEDEDASLLKWPMIEPYLFLWWEGKLLLAGHGTDFTDVRDKGLDSRADLVITGHTHVGSLVREGKTLFLNPGSASLPQGRDPASAALLDGDGIRILTLENRLLHFEPW